MIYVTFGGDKAAAQELGNLYFFTWLSFAITLWMITDSLNKLLGKEEEEEEGASEEEPATEPKGDTGDVQEEPAKAAVEDPAPAVEGDVEAAA